MVTNVHKYIYGVSKSIREDDELGLVRKFSIFVCKHEDSVPSRTILAKSALMSAADAYSLAKQECAKLENEYKDKPITGKEIANETKQKCGIMIESVEFSYNSTMRCNDNKEVINEIFETTIQQEEVIMARPKIILPGEIVSLADREGNHVGLVINIDKDFCELLLCTTNPNWNPFSRKLSNDERIYFGNIFIRSKTTYFAPVKRRTADVYSLGVSFPDHRVEGLKEEFHRRFIS